MRVLSVLVLLGGADFLRHHSINDARSTKGELDNPDLQADSEVEMREAGALKAHEESLEKHHTSTGNADEDELANEVTDEVSTQIQAEDLAVPSKRTPAEHVAKILRSLNSSAVSHKATQYPLPGPTDPKFKAEVYRTVKQGVSRYIWRTRDDIMEELRRRAIDHGKNAAVRAVEPTAWNHTYKAYAATKKLLTIRTAAYCKRLSRNKKLPKYCAEEAKSIFSSLESFRLNQWRLKAMQDAIIPTARMASVAAFRATNAKTTKEMMPIGRQAMRVVLRQDYPKYEKKWAQVQQAEFHALDEYKRKFWRDACNNMIKTMEDQAGKAIWGPSMKLADARMVRAAKKAAAPIALKIALRTLAPKFVQAGKELLPVAVKRAHVKAMAAWTTNWKPTQAGVVGNSSHKKDYDGGALDPEQLAEATESLEPNTVGVDFPGPAAPPIWRWGEDR
mmetsp:Transcript_51481/g.110294  ORF Transcript_51481/g.110294 Transcript_51481/m.110294 type:complete len:447 (-) Transcript_51481:47-1387(-)